MTEKVYAEKKDFVELLNQAVMKIPHAEAIEYKHISGKHSELIRLTWISGDYMYINVTGNSLSAILSEVAAAISGGKPAGRIISMRHAALVDEWWEAEQ